MPLVARISERSTGLLYATLALFLTLSFSSAQAQPADAALYATGEKVFKGNCASCHKPDKDMTGPALKGATARWEGKGDIHAWVKNSQAVIKSGNSYAVELFNKWNKSVMTPNALSDEEIDAVLYYADNFTPPVADVPPPTMNGEGDQGGDDASWTWLIVIGLMLAIVAVSLGGVKRSLANAVREAEGQQPLPDRTRWERFKGWAWENKVFASVLGLFIVVYIVLKLWDAAFVIGVYGGEEVAHYKPEQPIKFDHTLHAGADNLAINCQYCHSSASKSKHAGIPTANVCMNCHKSVDAGKKTGTAEIAKIYAAIGWDPSTQSYTGKEEPIRWVKVHNLPDHVYFSHQQHVTVGQLECQECHGPVDTEMDVVEQWSPLTMGWCIDCHGQKEVKMSGNGYYDEVMARLEETDMGHEQLMEYLKDDKISVKELGGWECAKCHY
ncbi:MAG: cytochrome c3 family protein [Flavobacteriales bacterium]|nr:c-type cytochrome [Flavobacteriales bacterium]